MAVLNLGIIAVQVVAGIAAHSVGLIADAGHNVGDVAAIAVSWGALRLARRSPSARRTYGLHRAGVLAAQANAVSMLVVCAVLGAEAVGRLAIPSRCAAPWW